MKKKLIIASVILASLIGLVALYDMTMAAGINELAELQRKAGKCQDNDCDAQAVVIINAAAKAAGMSPSTVQWCVGVDSWAAVRVHRGGLIKQSALWVMRLPCGPLDTLS